MVIMDLRFCLAAFPKSELAIALSYAKDSLDQGIFHFLNARTRRNTIFIDVGAHLGVMSGMVARRSGNESKIITVEPNKSLETYIQKNIALNNPTVIHQHLAAAISSSPGLQEFVPDQHDSRSSTVKTLDSSQSDFHEKETVKVYQLIDIVPKNAEDIVIKVDAEGHDLKIIKSLFENIADLNWQRATVIFENNPEAVRPITDDQHGMSASNILESFGYDAHFIDPASGVLTERLSPDNEHEAGNICVEVVGYN